MIISTKPRTGLTAAIGLSVIAIVDVDASPIVYLSQSREIHAIGFNYYPEFAQVEETLYANGFGPFDAYLSTGQIPGIAQQSSTLESDRIIGKGYGTGQHYIQIFNSSGSSEMNVHFEIKQEIEFQWFGSLTYYAKISLVGPYHNLNIENNNYGSTIEFYEGGTLVPGTYTLAAYCVGSGSSGGMGSLGVFDFTFQVVSPCYADCDQSGGLDIDDFVCFQTLYALQNEVTDCDGSGVLDIDDFVCFQTLYAVGC